MIQVGFSKWFKSQKREAIFTKVKISRLNDCPRVKGKWQQNVLSSHLKETPKQYIEVYYRIFISALFGEIF